MAFQIGEIENILKSLLRDCDTCITLQVNSNGTWDVTRWQDEEDCEALAQAEPSIHWALVKANDESERIEEGRND